MIKCHETVLFLNFQYCIAVWTALKSSRYGRLVAFLIPCNVCFCCTSHNNCMDEQSSPKPHERSCGLSCDRVGVYIQKCNKPMGESYGFPFRRNCETATCFLLCSGSPELIRCCQQFQLSLDH